MLKTTLFVMFLVSTSSAGLLVTLNSRGAADDDDKKAQEAVLKIRKALEDKKAEDAKKMAGDLASKIEDMEPAMNVMKPREDGGLGFGPKAGPDPKEDGIEAKIRALAKNKLEPAELAKQTNDLAQMAYTISAISHVAQAKGMPKDAKKAKPEDWKKWSESMNKDSLELAELAKGGKATPDQIHTVAKRLDGTCMKCHDNFAPAGAAAPVVGPEAPAKEKKLDLRGAVEEIEMMIHDHKESSARQLAEELGPKKAKLKSFMELYQPAEKGGLDAVGIEKRISELADARKKLDALDAAEQAATFIRMSRLIVAITLIAEVHYPPSFKEKWNQAAEDVQEAALELGKAARADDLDGDRIKAAAVRIQKGCASCHDRFRK